MNEHGSCVDVEPCRRSEVLHVITSGLLLCLQLELCC